MLIQELIDYKKHCPICNSLLNLSFVSSRKSLLKIREGKLLCNFVIDSFPLSNKKTGWIIDFVIDPKTNEFYIEFLTNSNYYYTAVPLSAINRYYEWFKNQVKVFKFKFSKKCLVCQKYDYSSSKIDIDHKTAKLSNVNIEYERFCLKKSDSNGLTTVYRFDNNYINNYSTFAAMDCLESEFDRFDSARYLPDSIQLSLIQIPNPFDYNKLLKQLQMINLMK